MLKALELSGFKSFADKTRFEFPAGITVVVGPNGSGKSNIVDGIKWVLGEQSAKSLRGKDMSDVIFKGAGGPGGRKPANAATATIILDNADRRFSFDADEVHVSRRVYRSGESEYLINGEASRLKDIRELFRGTGVGTDAYSLIEQGKVERMLSTNAKDRRTIFEEAAGISRFKAKKRDAERRLARVEGNLIRLADIVEEVGSRYRSVKAQASKAARYKEYSDRLQELRTFAGAKDWRQFSEKLNAAEAELLENRQQTEALQNELELLEQENGTVETELEATSEQLDQKQNRSTSVREAIARAESQLELNQARLSDIESRNAQASDQLNRALQRVHEAAKRIANAEQESETAELSFREASDLLDQLEQQYTEVDQQLQRLEEERVEQRQQQNELAKLVSELGKSVSAKETQLQSLTQSRKVTEELQQQLEQTIAEATEEQRTASAAIAELESEATSKNSALATAKDELQSVKSALDGRRQRLGELTNQLAGLTQRAQVIEELEQSLDGINAGAKELLKHAQDPSGPMEEIIGLVADLVAVNVQHAALVDVALGDIAQHVLVQGRQLINQIADQQVKLNGRVGLIQLNSPPDFGTDRSVNLNGVPGVIGRADRLVQVQPEHTEFIRGLLGGTWVVKTLGVALHLHENHEHADRVRFVSLDGEIVEADGTVMVGPKSATSGLVSRRSELRALKRELGRLEEEIDTCRSQLDQHAQQAATLEAEVETQLNENSELASRLSNQRAQAAAAEKTLEEAQSRKQKCDQELNEVASQVQTIDRDLVSQRESLVEHESTISQLVQWLSGNDQTANELTRNRSSIESERTAAKVKLAKAEQVLDGITNRVAQYRQEHEEQQQAHQVMVEQTESDQQAAQTAHEEIKAANEILGRLRGENETLLEELEKLQQQRSETDSKRRKLAIEVRGKQDQLSVLREKMHEAQVRIEQLNLQRQQLAERMRDDYGIEIAAAESALANEDEEQREAIDQEISDLRNKLNSIGSVNLDALQELEDLESRYLAMDEQYQDLVQAKETLEKIIQRIDNDSRRLFVETLDAIRTNFQKLFRQTFGGGKADIVLEPDVDPLEAGVDIIATPPGKPEFNNSLLSGGEKALTAVSLLMAIFQFRPSPFCVLDEVDAPFDEANIGRFIDVLKSFLGWTKFVIVTHSKKTMTAATTLYGITMQESGVSKRVSVRFEDVSEDGHISEEAIRRSDDDAA